MSRARLLGAAAMAVLASFSCTRRDAPESSPNVLVIVIDTLRADRVGVYGNDRGLTPFLDRLAARGVVFAKAYAASSWTNPSIASLFTSRYPTQHRVATYESVLASSERTLAERLSETGYLSGGFLANVRLTGSLGFAQGFDAWKTLPGQKPRAADVRRSALQWLDGETAKGVRRPRLLYLHYMEPHPPFDPPEPFKARLQRDADGGGGRVDQASANAKLTGYEFDRLSPEEVDLLQSLYDAEVAAIDDELRLVFDELQSRGFLDNAVTLVTSDHGTEFNEHGFFLHGFRLFNESIKVPLLLLAPGIRAGQVIEENVSLVDVAPTILDLVGLPAEPRFEGRSLVPLLEGSQLAPRQRETDVLSELLDKEMSFELRLHEECLIRRSTKLVIQPDGTPQIFDLAADPGEKTPNPPSLVGEIEPLRAALDGVQAELATRQNPRHETQPIDEGLKERLRALGYPVEGKETP